MGTVPRDIILDSVKGFFKSIFQEMMIEERAIFLETNSETKANGYYPRKINSVFGEISDFKIPRTRDSSFRSVLVPQGKTDPHLEELISELYSAGISSRKIEGVLTKHFGVSLSHSSVARLAAVAYEEVQAWQKRSLRNFDAIFIDAFYFPVKRETVQKEAVYVALGIDSEGHREVIGFWIPGGAEGSSNWKEIFIGLKEQGVLEVDYIIADGLTGIENAISEVYPNAKYQYCIVHACRSSLNKVRASDKSKVSEDLKQIYYADSKMNAKKSLSKFKEKWGKSYPKIIEFWEGKFDLLTNFMSLPDDLRRFIYTTNWVERLHKEIKRRIKSMEQFQSVASAEKILYSLYKEQNERYKKSGVNRWKVLYRKS